MSEKDPLKSIFDKAFDQEAIPFDPQGWEQMESMLDAQPSNRAGYFWLFSGIALVAAGIGLSMLNSGLAESYHPRSSFADYATIEDVNLSITPNNIDPNTISVNAPTSDTPDPVNAPASSPEAQPQTTATLTTASNPIESSTPGTPIHSSAQNSAGRSNPSASATSAAQETINAAAVATTVNPVVPDQQESSPAGQPSLDQTAVAPKMPSNIASQSAPTPVILEEQQKDNLDKMEALGLGSENDARDVVTTDPEPETKARPALRPYARFGFVKTAETKDLRAFDGWGQTAGVGIEWRAAPHFLISTDVNLYREQVRYTLDANSEQYGFFRTQESSQVNVTEIVSAEVPLMLHYRWNRWNIGTGVSAQFILSSRISETYETSSTASDFTPTNEETFDGYARWSEMTPLNINVPVQVMYRFSDNYYIGGRYRYGFNDLFRLNGVTDRKTGFEIFIRMNL